MGGILFKMPMTTTVAIIGMISMMAPPFGMLIGKWIAIESAAHQPLILILFIAGSALTIFFWAKWLGRITTTSYHESFALEPGSRWMQGVLLVMGLGVILASVAAMPIYLYVIKPVSLTVFGVIRSTETRYLLDSAEQFLGWPLWVVLGALIMAGVSSVFFFKRSHVRLPYLCGENIPDAEFSFEFRSVADQPSMALLNSYYLSPIFGEEKITSWCNPLAGLIVLTLFGVLFI
jgi:ech hydrogenase subunit A